MTALGYRRVFTRTHAIRYRLAGTDTDRPSFLLTPGPVVRPSARFHFVFAAPSCNAVDRIRDLAVPLIRLVSDGTSLERVGRRCLELDIYEVVSARLCSSRNTRGIATAWCR